MWNRDAVRTTIRTGLVLVATGAGCSTWWNQAKPKPAAPKPALRLIFASVPDDRASDLAVVWGQTEPLAVGADHYKHLDANGFRLGRSRPPHPDPLGQGFVKGKFRLTANPRLTIYPGLRVVAKPPGETRRCTVMHRDVFGGVSGSDFPNARTVLGIRCMDIGPNGVRLRLVPEVHYQHDRPPARPGRAPSLRRVRLQIHRYDDLSWEVTLPLGAWLVVGCDAKRSLSVASQALLAQKLGRTLVGLMIVQVGARAPLVPHTQARETP